MISLQGVQMVTKIIDNKNNGKVIDELKENLEKSSKISIISAYFTIYAYQELQNELKNIEELRFIFTSPAFITEKLKKKKENYIFLDLMELVKILLILNMDKSRA